MTLGVASHDSLEVKECLPLLDGRGRVQKTLAKLVLMGDGARQLRESAGQKLGTELARERQQCTHEVDEVADLRPREIVLQSL